MSVLPRHVTATTGGIRILPVSTRATRLVAGFSLHQDRAEAARRGQEGFEFFGHALDALVAHHEIPGRTSLWREFQASRSRDSVERRIAAATRR
jgi:hypothetical protein